MLCALHPSCDVMWDNARVTVRTRPTPNYVPRKERRYHVKNKFAGNEPTKIEVAVHKDIDNKQHLLFRYVSTRKTTDFTCV